jgi:hypothetical protein
MKNSNFKWVKSLFVLGVVYSLSGLNLNAQTTDSIKKNEKEFKNTIHFNITNPMIFGNKSIIFGYERILKNNRSFSINIGQTGFPSLDIIDSEELKANTILSERGFHISGDYRFYLSKVNKYNAPRGVYIGPYYGYNSFDKGHSWTLKSETSGFEGNVNSELGLTIQTVGVELGYQFVFWKRFSVDMILLGPGVGFYRWDLSLDTSLSDEDSALFFEKLNAALEAKFPGYDGTLGEGEFQRKGAKSTTGLGYRYMIQLGYRF